MSPLISHSGTSRFGPITAASPIWELFSTVYSCFHSFSLLQVRDYSMTGSTTSPIIVAGGGAEAAGEAIGATTGTGVAANWVV